MERQFTEEEIKKLWEIRNDYKAGKLSENVKPIKRRKAKNARIISNRANRAKNRRSKPPEVL